MLPLSLLLLVVDHQTRWLQLPRAWLQFIVVPLHVLADAPSRTAKGVREVLTTREQLMQERDELRDEVERMQLEAQRLATLEVENNRLRSLLDSKERLTLNVRSAEVIGVVPDPAVQQFILDKGSEQGVFVGQAVLSADGLVGQVIEVTPITSRVLLITDTSHAVSTQVVRSGYRVVVEGMGRPDLMRVRYVTDSTNIEEGDLLVSSGLDDLYPAGYPVARVKQVHRSGTSDGSALFAETLAVPLAKLEVASHVLLVFRHIEKMPSAAPLEAVGAAAAGGVANADAVAIGANAGSPLPPAVGTSPESSSTTPTHSPSLQTPGSAQRSEQPSSGPQHSSFDAGSRTESNATRDPALGANTSAAARTDASSATPAAAVLTPEGTTPDGTPPANQLQAPDVETGSANSDTAQSATDGQRSSPPPSQVEPL